MRLALWLASFGLVGSAACYDYSLPRKDPAKENVKVVEPTSPPPDLATSDGSGDDDVDDAGSVVTHDGEAGVPSETACQGALHCDADLLTRCRKHADGLQTVAKCANGCIVHQPEADDECSAPTPCKPGALYCGGNKVNGVPTTLYTCGDGGLTATPSALCPNGCAISVTGGNDRCK
jgi:hypothetical protein